MFEDLAKTVSNEMLSVSRGQLNCLPYSRALLDLFEVRRMSANAVVARAVVFGRLEGIEWNDLLIAVPIKSLLDEAIGSTNANGALHIEFTSQGEKNAQKVVVPYRTLGFTHGTAALGSYHEDGSWNGHLVIVSDNTLIDLTIGQLNDSNFGINFMPPYITIETDDGFLSGRQPLIGIQDEMLVCYRAYPAERTYEQSLSWSEVNFRRQLQQIGLRSAQIASRSSSGSEQDGRQSG